MELSKSELLVLEQVALGTKRLNEISLALNKSRSQIYRSSNNLVSKGIMTLNRGVFEPAKLTHISLLIQLLSEFNSLIEPLSDSGMELFCLLTTPKSILEIIKTSGLKRTQIFKKIKEARSISLVKKVNHNYSLNETLWAKAFTFFEELNKYNETIDERVPVNSMIYYKTSGEIIFSNIEKIDATLTAFSAYEKYGIKILSGKSYYHLPKRKLTRKEVFKHSLIIAKKTHNLQDLIIVTLFFAKYKNELLSVKDELLVDIKKVLKGESLLGYPTLAEIKDRAEVYDITI